MIRGKSANAGASATVALTGADAMGMGGSPVFAFVIFWFGGGFLPHKQTMFAAQFEARQQLFRFLG